MLVIRLDRIGDMVNTAPALKILAETFPHWKITLLAGHCCEPLMQAMPYVKDVIFWDAPWLSKQNPFKAFKQTCAVIKTLRRSKYELVIDFRGDFRNIILAYLVGIPHRVGFDITGCGFLLTDPVEHDDDHHNVSLAKKVVHHFVPNATFDHTGALVLSENDFQQVNTILAPAIGRPSIPLVVIHPSARWAQRQWSPKKYAYICDWIADQYNATVVMTGTKQDVPLVDQIASMTTHKPIIMAGQLSLTEFLALLEQASFFIGVDSGPMHMAAAVDTPAIALLGPALPQSVGPIGKNHIIITAQQHFSCAPCAQKKCKKAGHSCMDAITVDDVCQAIETQVNRINNEKSAIRKTQKNLV